MNNTVAAPASLLKYWAFISYSHQDNLKIRADGSGRHVQWGNWLHEQLETYRIADDYRDRTVASGEPMPERFHPSFRDEAELPTSHDLGQQIRDALDRSRFLIVIASRNSAKSRYVNEEVRYFRQIGRGDRILVLIIDGEPNVRLTPKQGWQEEDECFCPALVHPLRADGSIDEAALLAEEPIAADVRLKGEDHRPREVNEFEWGFPENRELLDFMRLKLLAGLMGVGLDELVQRDKVRQLEHARRQARTLRRWLATVGALALAAFVGGASALIQWRRAEQSRLGEEVARKSATSNATAAEKSAAEAQTSAVAARTSEAEAKKQTALAEKNRSRAEAERQAAETELYRNSVLLANAQMREGSADLAEETLWTAPEKERGWEWGFLLAQCHKDLGRFSANPGEYVYSQGSSDGKMGIYWQRRERTEDGEKPKVTNLWSLMITAEGTLHRHHVEVPEAVVSVSFSKDNKRALVVTEERWKLYDATLENVIAEGKGHRGTAGGFVDAGGHLFVIATESSWSLLEEKGASVKIRKTALGEFSWKRIEGDGKGKYWAMFGSDDADVFSVSSGKITSCEIAFPSDVAFSPDGLRLAFCGEEESLYVWDARAGKKDFVKKAEGVPVNRSNAKSCVVTWSKTQLVMANSHGIWTWDLEKDGRLSEDGGDPILLKEEPISLAASAQWIAVGLRSGPIDLIAVDGLRPVANLAGHDGGIESLHLSGNKLFSVGVDGTLRAWKLEAETWVTEEEAKNWLGGFSWKDSVTSGSTAALPDPEYRLLNRAHRNFAYAVGRSEKLNRLASAGSDMMVRVWDSSTQRILLTISGLGDEGTGCTAMNVAFDRTGTTLGAKAYLGKGLICNGVWRAWPFTRSDFGSADLGWRPAFQKWKEQKFLQWWQTKEASE